MGTDRGFAAMVVCAGCHGYLDVPMARDTFGAVVVDSIDHPTRPMKSTGPEHPFLGPAPRPESYTQALPPLDSGVDGNGYDVSRIGGYSFQRALVDVIRDAYPGAQWSVAPFGMWSLARATTIDGRAVGLVCGLLREGA